MKRTTLFLVAVAVILGINLSTRAQVAINSTGDAPNSSAMLDVSSSNKGLLIPYVALTDPSDATTIPSPAISLLVYNYTTRSGLTPGYYYNSGTTYAPVWTRLLTEMADGSETRVTSGTNVTVTGTGTAGNPYIINAEGPAKLEVGLVYQGGIIFWLDATGQHGLIAASDDQSTGITWYNEIYRYTGSTGDGLYAGAMNTAMIVSLQMSDYQGGNFAAKVCADYTYTYGGVTYGDWYLPSKYELNLLYLQRAIVGGFANTYYWSSTEVSSNFVWGQSFENGNQGAGGKEYTSTRVRAIRAF
ncbi:MAG: hypothetical protein WCP85_23430 [Mariniphaga sp.]